MGSPETVEGVWVFNGEVGRGSRFAGAVFTTRGRAEGWIDRHRLSGVLTLYPLDTGVYEWAIERGLFRPSQERHREPEFIGTFTTASQQHAHYEDGRLVAD